MGGSGRAAVADRFGSAHRENTDEPLPDPDGGAPRMRVPARRCVLFTDVPGRAGGGRTRRSELVRWRRSDRTEPRPPIGGGDPMRTRRAGSALTVELRVNILSLGRGRAVAVEE